MKTATEKFDSIFERRGASPSFQSTLHKFLQKHPNHIDALHHYALCLRDEGRNIEALAFSQTAVVIGMRVFPKQFFIGRDRLPTGFHQNRPFLRALHGLMLAQRTVELIEDAVETGETCLALDREDRMGARQSLVIYLIECGRDKIALNLFESPAYKGTFFDTEYLHALALIRLDCEKEARSVLRGCLQCYPQVARFILDHSLPQPVNEDCYESASSGSELEGWQQAQYFDSLWRSNRAAMKILREESRPYAEQGWKGYAKEAN